MVPPCCHRNFCIWQFRTEKPDELSCRFSQLIPSTMKLSAEGSEFFFYYTLLGNDITSEPFRNLLSPDFEPERASVRIRSSKQILQTFLAQQPSLQVRIKSVQNLSQSGRVSRHLPFGPSQIHLCCGNHSLGSTDVSLSALSAVSVDLDIKAANVEGAFILQPPKRIKKTLPALPADQQATVGVSVTLRREEVTQKVHSQEWIVLRVSSLP